ncbi:MAG: hypothetical protein ACYC56_11340 [Candidatus Aquicultor sp.]
MAAGDRSQSIYGRIHRVLTKNYEYGVNKILKEEIYDEMRQAQLQIFPLVLPEKTYEISLAEDVSEYPLLKSPVKRDIIDKIKTVITPEDWTYRFSMVSNNRWNEILKSSTSITQPTFGTIINHVLNVYATPDSSTDGDSIKLITNNKAPETTISDKIDPELPELFDKDIEWLALFAITGDVKWYNLFDAKIKEKTKFGNQSAEEETVKECMW